MSRRLGFLLAILLTLVATYIVYPRPEKRWIVEGVASSTGLDFNGNRMMVAALENATWQLHMYPTVLWNHDEDRPIGRVLSTAVRTGLLWVKLEISKHEPELWYRIRKGYVSGFSIRGVAWETEPDFNLSRMQETTYIKRGFLFEVSIVSLPANPAARIKRCYEE